ncbi:hypothetical protein T01_5854 [Trichinella spiralis]|uniref:Uncharacterized protein n=1 Tax=Trichinella spiralis TaxID=6334 RepID=A0A0V1ATQ5_TRISP|nr:hypothetical protein T01_5854 [Trichinella spiralis]
MLKERSSSPPRKLVELKRRLQFFAEELDQLCKENVAAGRIEAELVTTEEIYRRVDRFREEYETGLDGEEAATAIADAGELPKYGGDVTEFRGFWDRFADSIHKRTDLSDGTKLTYLHGCLTGDALRAISCLSSNGLYKVAVQRLKERFDRPYTAVRKLTLDLLRITTGEWTMGRLPDHIDCHIDTLTEMGKDPRTAEFSLAELYADEKLQSDLAAFQRFIREQMGLMAESHWSIFKTGRNWKPGKASESSKTKSTIRKGSLPVLACPEVLKANSIQRRALDKKAGLCFSYLEPGHEAKGCGQRGGKKNSGRSSDSPAPLSGVKPSDPSQERDQKEGKQLRPVRVNLTSGDESGGTRLQIIRARAHSDGGKKMVVNCLFDTAAERSFIRENVAQELQLKRFLLC